MRETILCFGPPGTGKTEYCISQVEHYLRKQNGRPNRIAFVSFTRKAAQEARERAADAFGLSDADLPFYCTLHALAYRCLGLSRSDVMNDTAWKDFEEKTGFRVSHAGEDGFEPGNLEDADPLLRVYSVARARGRTIEEEWRQGDYEDIPLWAAERFAAELTAYKARMRLMDFSDFLDEAMECEPLDIDLLVIDEAQDLTPQQWRFVRHIGQYAKRVIIAGDDDQAIYEWNGADAKQLRRFKGTKLVLPESRRVPREIQAVARAVIEKVRDREPKEWRPRAGDGGRVITLSSIDDISLDAHPGTWLLLARHKHALRALEAFARKQGVIYFKNKTWSNEHRSVRAVRAYMTLVRGRFVSANDARLVTDYIPDMVPPPQGLQNVCAADLSWPWNDFPPWWDALRRLALEDIAYLRAVLKRGESLTEPGRVIISTVHGVKGGQADNVVLFGNATKRILRQEAINPDSEYRVRYVAMTRARQTLYVLPGYFG